MKNNFQGACSRCKWPFKKGDIFCGNCRSQLARLVVSPDPKKDLRGKPLKLYEGFPLILKIRNAGEIPISLTDLHVVMDGSVQSGDPWDIWVSDTQIPFDLNPEEEIEIGRKHNLTSGHAGRLELATSCLPVVIYFRVQALPQIVLTGDSGRKFEHSSTSPIFCPMDEKLGRTNLTLGIETGTLQLESPPRIESKEGELDLAVTTDVSDYPLEMTPTREFAFSIVRREDLPEDGFEIDLTFSFQNLGDVTFYLLLRYIRIPVLRVLLDPPSFTHENAIISGSKAPKEIKATITHLEGSSLRIDSITSDKPWLKTVELDSIIGQILNAKDPTRELTEENERQIVLCLETAELPKVKTQTEFFAVLTIEGETIGEDEKFEYKKELVVLVKPPEILDSPIAVDFGTTNSCVAYMDPKSAGERLKLVELDRDDTPFEAPTAFQFLTIANVDDRIELLEKLHIDESQFCVGKGSDEREAIMRFGNIPYSSVVETKEDIVGPRYWRIIPTVCWSFKRFLASPNLKFVYTDIGMSTVRINGRLYLEGNHHIGLVPIEMAAIYLRFLLERFCEETGYVPRDCIFTFPAVFNRQKEALLSSAALAMKGLKAEGFDVKIHLDISEPEAIAVYHVYQMIERKAEIGEKLIIGVFDCGGGTTDISIVRFERDDEGFRLEILASDGDNTLGGDLLTFRIAEYIYNSVVPEQYRKQIPFPKDLREGLHTHDRIIKTNFLQLYIISEKIKTNIREFGRFDACFDGEFYENKLRTGSMEKGILDLLLDDDMEIFWPTLRLKSTVPNEFLRVYNNKREIFAEEEKSNQELPQLQPMDGNKVRERLTNELNRGFKKLAQMQDALFHQNITTDYRLDRLILAGNSASLSLLEGLAQDWNLAREITYPSINKEETKKELKISVASGAAIYGEAMIHPDRTLKVIGVQKLNYPIGTYEPMNRFKVVFDRWIPLSPEFYPAPSEPLAPPYEYMSKGYSRKIENILLYEWFDWDYKKKLDIATGRKIAEIPVPFQDLANSQVWQYVLQIRCDAPGQAQLLYNFKVGEKGDGDDFEYLWPEFRKCEGFCPS